MLRPPHNQAGTPCGPPNPQPHVPQLQERWFHLFLGPYQGHPRNSAVHVYASSLPLSSRHASPTIYLIPSRKMVLKEQERSRNSTREECGSTSSITSIHQCLLWSMIQLILFYQHCIQLSARQCSWRCWSGSCGGGTAPAVVV